MRRIRNALMWLFMLWKRQFKKPDYLILLAVISALAFFLNVFSSDSQGITRVAIYAESGETEAVLRESEKNGTAIKYTYFSSEAEARHAVTNGGYDSAWILSGELDRAARELVLRGTPMATVFQREETVFLRLSREKLYATLYPHVSKALYDSFMHSNFDSPDQTEIDRLYYTQSEGRDIIEIEFNNSDTDPSRLSFLASPLRGLLAVALFLCAYSALMGFKKDREGGMFDRIPLRRIAFVEIAYILISVTNAAVLMLISLKMTGIFTSAALELLLIAVYVLLCTAFCVIMGELTDSIDILGALMPILTIAMLVLCPVFINLVNIPALQMLLPTYHYLNSFRNMSHLLQSVIYLLMSAAIYCIICIVKRITLRMRK